MLYTIGETAQLTGISAYTLRYYEKIGVLPKPQRLEGGRRYDEQDLRYIRFIHGLKQTGMSLEDIAAFTEDGCLLTRSSEEFDLVVTLNKRLSILSQHIGKLNEQIKELEAVKAIAGEKSAYYATLLEKADGGLPSSKRECEA